MRILGLDTATIDLGYGIVDHGPKGFTYVDCGVLHAPAGWRRWRRLRELHRDLVELITVFQPTRAALEGGVDKYPAAALAGGESRGVALAALFAAGLSDDDVTECAPTAVKMAATGSGRATKQAVARMMAVRFGLKKLPAFDATDALAIALASVVGVATKPKRR